MSSERHKYRAGRGNILKNNQHAITCDALRDLAPFIQFKKREKHPWRRVTFSKVAGFTKSRNASQMLNITKNI